MAHGCLNQWGSRASALITTLTNLGANRNTGWGAKLRNLPDYSQLVLVRNEVHFALGDGPQASVNHVGGTIQAQSLNADATSVLNGLLGHKNAPVHADANGAMGALGWLSAGDFELPAVNMAVSLRTIVKECLDPPPGGEEGVTRAKPKTKPKTKPRTKPHTKPKTKPKKRPTRGKGRRTRRGGR